MMISSLWQCAGRHRVQNTRRRDRRQNSPRISTADQGALRGEHPGRSRNPLIKVANLAWLEFEKPDLDRAEVFARDFGFRDRRPQ
ncbi:hypothetical protein SVIOM342S_03705 [Streptomyces violaceorubidus]